MSRQHGQPQDFSHDYSHASSQQYPLTERYTASQNRQQPQMYPPTVSEAFSGSEDTYGPNPQLLQQHPNDPSQYGRRNQQYSQRHDQAYDPEQEPFQHDHPNAPLLNSAYAPSQVSLAGNNNSDDDAPQMHYGRAPARQVRRHKTTKRVELFQGNLVLDCPVPTKLLAMSPYKDEHEFTNMRYTAVTCEPDNFKRDRYTLRQNLYNPPRPTELFIVLTMYNEDEVLFTRTMHSVVKNIAHLCKRDRSRTWGKEGWKKIVVCIVSDGRSKINPRTLSVLAAMGCYQEGVAKNSVLGKPVTAHLYEYTTQVSYNADMEIRGSKDGIVPVQVLFCLKEKNQKKINSHRWFFNAFGPLLQPNVCVLLDVGTKPGNTSIYPLWKAFDVNSNIGGACGEIVAMKGKYGGNLLNPLVATQNFEYKMSNILDKPLESVFGYITVLPGAFSAYRYIALQNDAQGNGPLASYFKGEALHGADANIFDANMYLAEDRILCFELVSKRNCSWILHYVKSAYAETDVPDTVPELISQRRRWLNGSFFAAVHALFHFHHTWRSDHSFGRKFLLHIEFIYQAFQLFFSWFALANFFITFDILAASLAEPSLGLPGVFVVLYKIFEYLYIATVIMSFVLAMGNRPQGSKWSYTGAMILFAVIMVYMLFASGFLTYKGVQGAIDAINNDGGKITPDLNTVGLIFKDPIFRTIILSLLATYGLYLVSSLMFLDPWHMFTSFLQYSLMAISFTNILNVYAFCNTHDVSWGTKGDNQMKTDLGVVAKKEDGTVEVSMPTHENDINALYDDAIATLHEKAVIAPAVVSASQRQEDYYKTFRTNTVLAWILSNLLLIAIILSTNQGSIVQGDQTTSIYLSFLLYSVVALAAIRFIGSTIYLVLFIFQG